ncbi:hypothetical protein GUJ93_ZPchr0006g44883 [Zizania palustris]|uniref:Uncharacterized protein n=1 Tax=Zizania palustris TaxID=103762 RepID=A0A8J5VK47_ZIZPA|nr:hypothetical protein GUJ93_ZPchr0006g44883 [Zizania palustris]
MSYPRLRATSTASTCDDCTPVTRCKANGGRAGAPDVDHSVGIPALAAVPVAAMAMGAAATRKMRAVAAGLVATPLPL